MKRGRRPATAGVKSVPRGEWGLRIARGSGYAPPPVRHHGGLYAPPRTFRRVSPLESRPNLTMSKTHIAQFLRFQLHA